MFEGPLLILRSGAHHGHAGADVEIALLEQNIRICGSTRKTASIGRNTIIKEARLLRKERRDIITMKSSPKVPDF